MLLSASVLACRLVSTWQLFQLSLFTGGEGWGWLTCRWRKPARTVDVGWQEHQASMFQSASTQRPSQLSSSRWRCKDICQVASIGNLTYVILVIHAQISGTYCWIASIFLMHVYSLSQSVKWKMGITRRIFFFPFKANLIQFKCCDLKSSNQFKTGDDASPSYTINKMQQSQKMTQTLIRGFAVNQFCQSGLTPSSASSTKVAVVIVTYTGQGQGNTSWKGRCGFVDRSRINWSPALFQQRGAVVLQAELKSVWNKSRITVMSSTGQRPLWSRDCIWHRTLQEVGISQLKFQASDLKVFQIQDDKMTSFFASAQQQRSR